MESIDLRQVGRAYAISIFIWGALSNDARFVFCIEQERTANATLFLPALSTHEALEELPVSTHSESTGENHARTDCR